MEDVILGEIQSSDILVYRDLVFLSTAENYSTTLTMFNVCPLILRPADKREREEP